MSLLKYFLLRVHFLKSFDETNSICSQKRTKKKLWAAWLDVRTVSQAKWMLSKEEINWLMWSQNHFNSLQKSRFHKIVLFHLARAEFDLKFAVATFLFFIVGYILTFLTTNASFTWVDPTNPLFSATEFRSLF